MSRFGRRGSGRQGDGKRPIEIASSMGTLAHRGTLGCTDTQCGQRIAGRGILDALGDRVEAKPSLATSVITASRSVWVRLEWMS
jgi:hypothetical protein